MTLESPRDKSKPAIHPTEYKDFGNLLSKMHILKKKQRSRQVNSINNESQFNNLIKSVDKLIE